MKSTNDQRAISNHEQDMLSDHIFTIYFSSSFPQSNSIVDSLLQKLEKAGGDAIGPKLTTISYFVVLLASKCSMINIVGAKITIIMSVVTLKSFMRKKADMQI
ncbi:MAG: hypothetical protein MI975_21390 [Cytophagales bacterium]|nr:hypothetical protein [Cytophagales bacterium]